MTVSTRKEQYFQKLIGLFGKYDYILLINIDNVGSRQLQNMRAQLRGRAVVLMGKNTLIRKALRTYVEDGHSEMAPLMEHIRGNIGLVFSSEDLSALREELEAEKVPAAAKPGTRAPLDVWLPRGGTGLEPTKTSFMQALDIATKIVRGQIDILNPVHLIKEGQVVGASQAQLLQMLNIMPFTYGIKVVTVYDAGFVYGAQLLSLTDQDMLRFFARGVQRVAALSLAIGHPTIASIPHSLANAYRSVVSVALELSDAYSFPGVDTVRAYLADPSAFAPAVTESAAADEPEPEPEPEEEEESEDLDLDLFG